MGYIKKSILRRLLVSYLAFGLFVALMFPFYAEFFVDWKPGMYVWFVTGCIVAGLTIEVGNYYLVKIILLNKLKNMATITTAISNKDVTQECALQSEDMLGDMAKGMNRMTATLRNMIQQITTDAQALENASSSMRNIVGNSSDDIQNQLCQVEQVAAAMQEMAASALQIARHAEESANVTAEADQQGDEGKVVIVEAMSAVDTLAGMVQEAAGVINNLEAESENIGSVLAVINGIAEQTNLLALNAAIEAARAGEHGRGFAVVADEVRTLATRTQQSTEEISNMIDNLQSGTRKAVEVMEQGSEQATKGVELTEKATEILAEISGSIRTLKDMSMQVAGASKEQSSVIEDVNKSILVINEVCEHTSEGMKQVSATSQEVASNAIKLHEMVADFKT